MDINEAEKIVSDPEMTKFLTELGIYYAFRTIEFNPEAFTIVKDIVSRSQQFDIDRLKQFAVDCDIEHTNEMIYNAARYYRAMAKNYLLTKGN